MYGRSSHTTPSKANMDPACAFDSYSSPNLARHRHPHGQHVQKSIHIASSSQLRHNHAVSSHDVVDSHDLLGPDDKDAHSSSKMSRSERKRMWRKNLSAEKLAKLRERDALRKRVERMNMSAEKRRDLRTKDTARKAALRKERRKGDASNGPPSSGPHTPIDDSSDQYRNRHMYGDSVEIDGRQRHRKSDPKYSDEESFNKIPVQSLLN